MVLSRSDWGLSQIVGYTKLAVLVKGHAILKPCNSWVPNFRPPHGGESQWHWWAFAVERPTRSLSDVSREDRQSRRQEIYRLLWWWFSIPSGNQAGLDMAGWQIPKTQWAMGKSWKIIAQGGGPLPCLITKG